MKPFPSAAVLAFLPAILAAEAAPAGPPPRPASSVTPARPLAAAFDADGDGRLSPSERAAAKAALREKAAARRAERFQRLDTDRDGRISRPEWNAAPGPRLRPQASPEAGAGILRRRLLEKFDADRDGVLSGAERLQARRALREWFMK